MESVPNFGNDHTAPTTALLNSTFKHEIPNYEFSINLSSKNYLQDFHHLDPFSVATDSPFYAFEPFFHGCSSNLELYECEGITGAAMQGGGFMSFPKGKDDDHEFMGIEEAALNICHDHNPLSMVVPDESSCVTADFRKDGGGGGKRGKIRVCEGGRKPVGRRKSKSGKGPWTMEEDRLLVSLVEKYGERKWSRIAQMVKGRIGKQCRERWHNHLRPDIKKDLWTEEEDRVLIESHAEVGNKWAEIAKRLPGRTENSIKNHWNATKRRQFSRRKCRTKWPKPSSLLQNYIKSLNFEKGGGSSGRSRKAAPPPPNTTAISGNFRSVLNSTAAVSDMDVQAGDDRMVLEYDVPDLSFMDDLPDCPPPEFDDGGCFDVDQLPFDLPGDSMDAGRV